MRHCWRVICLCLEGQRSSWLPPTPQDRSRVTCLSPMTPAGQARIHGSVVDYLIEIIAGGDSGQRDEALRHASVTLKNVFQWEPSILDDDKVTVAKMPNIDY